MQSQRARRQRLGRAAMAMAAGLALALAMSPLAAATPAPDPIAVAELLRNARLWQQLGRDDNLRYVLEKLLALDDGQPQALLGLAELALRQGRVDEAQRLLARLQRSGAADAPAAAARLQERLGAGAQGSLRVPSPPLLRPGEDTERVAMAQSGRRPGQARAPKLAARPATRPATRPVPVPPAAATAAVPAPAAAEVRPTIDVAAVRSAAERDLADDQPGAALQRLERALAQSPRDPWLRHDLSRLYASLGRDAQARSVLADGLAATAKEAPGSAEDAEMRYAAALALAARGDDNQALALLAEVPEALRSDGQRALTSRLRDADAQRAAQALANADAAAAEAARRVSERQSRRRHTEEFALLPFYRQASDGLSTLKGFELPLVVTRPDDDGVPGIGASPDAAPPHRWLHVDAVELDAGALAPDFPSASAFGQVLASGQGLMAPLAQRARGLNAAIGITTPEERWDLGVIGAGFQVPNVVGGWQRDFTLAGHSANVALSRRVLTGSLLSYAGTRDPVSGRRWGGVTLRAVSLRMDAKLAGWDSSVSVMAGRLVGRNVASNSTVQLRVAGERGVIDTPALRLNMGLALSAWHYQRNLSFFSFGQGGYYSPQRYINLALPLQAQGRLGGWSYRVRGSAGHSRTFEASTPYHPTDAALQAAAGNAVHPGGGRGGGGSTSLRAEVERRLSPHWSVGGSYFADRSAYYAPTQWLFYLRHHANPQGGEIPLPRPVQPYSQF